jgi:hypothetical protein
MVKTNMKARMVTDTYHSPTLVHRGQMGKRQQPRRGGGEEEERERERERKMGEGKGGRGERK